MKTCAKLTGRLRAVLLVGAALAGLVGCPNLSRDLDLKSRIETDVLEANAEQISIQVVPESSAMGSTSPSGTTSAKLGVAFQVSAAAYAEYAFVRWEKTSGDGDVSFADATSLETMATITGNGTGIVITARFDARPVVVIAEPAGTGVLVNSPIAITFSEDVADSTVDLGGAITVLVSPDRATWAAPVGVTLAKSVSGSLVTISLTSGTWGINYFVRVIVLKTVTDLDGHMMPQDMFWQFQTGTSSDTENPNLVSLAIMDGATTIPDGGATNLSSGLSISTTATDNLPPPATMRVTETDLSTLATSFIDRVYSTNLAYNLQTPGDGTKRIDVFVRDGVNNESNVRSQDIVLDTVLPIITSASINGGAAVATSTTVTVALGATDDRSGLYQYQLSEAADFSGGTTTPWTAWTPTPSYTFSAGDGTKTVYARVRDAAGNVSTEAVLNHDSIALDAAGPTFSSGVVLAGGAGTTTGTTVSLAISATDAGSSVAQYRLSEAADFTGGTTTVWTDVPLPTTCTLSTGDGLKTIYVQLKDANGNISTETTLNHDSILLDQQGPTFSSVVVLGGGAAATASPTGVAISISATDAGSSIAHYRLSEAADFTGGTTTAWTPVPLPTTVNLTTGDGLKTMYVQLRDANNNVSTETSLNHDSITLDQTGPVFPSVVVLGAGAVYTGSITVSISITATDASSSIAHYRLSEASDFTGGTTTAWTAVPLPTTCSLSTGSGLKTIYVQLRDSVGNVSTEAVLNHDTITLDQQVPTFSSTVSINGGAALATNAVVSLSISATDAGSGIADYQLSEASDFSGGTTTTWTTWGGSPQTAPFTLSADGPRTVYVRLRDGVGNISTETTMNHDSITLDASGPTFSSAVVLGGGAASTTGTTVLLAISATDAGSSIAHYRLSEASDFTGGTTTAWTAVPLPTTYTFAAGDGQRFVYVQLRDANSNVSTDTTLNHDDIRLDQEPPAFSSQVSINSGAAGTKNATVSVAISATDAGTSIAEYQLSEAANFTGPTTTSWTTWAGSPVSFTLSSGDGTKTIYVRLEDENGHVSTEATLNYDDIILDTAAPQISSVDMGTGNTSAVVAFDEDIFGDAVQGPLASDALTVVPPSGAVLLGTSTAKTGIGQATITIAWLVPPSTGQTIGIQATSATSIYDSVGNAMAAGAGGSGTAKRLSFSTASGGSGGVIDTVQSVLSTFRGAGNAPAAPGGISFPSSGQGGAAAVAQTPAAPSASSPARAAVSSVQPLAQFQRPITTERRVGGEAAVAAAPAGVSTSRAVAEAGGAKAAPVVLPAVSTTTAVPVRTSMSDMATLASLEVQPAEERQAPSPWPVAGFALCAALLLAGGLFAARLLARSGSRR